LPGTSCKYEVALGLVGMVRGVDYAGVKPQQTEKEKQGKNNG
jgi:hypothetical protein